MAVSEDRTAAAEGSTTRFWQKINLIAEISAACRGLQPKAPSFEIVLELIQRIIPFDAATLYLSDSVSGSFVAKATLQEEVLLPELLVSRGDMEPDEWQPRLRQPLLWSSDNDADGFAPRSPFAAVLAVPLSVEHEVIGLLNLGSYTAGVLTRRQIKLMSVVADQLAVSIERLGYVARIEAQNLALQEAHRQLTASQDQVIASERLAAVAELAASVNHQINNPLSVIVGHAQCLGLEEKQLSDRCRERLERIVSAALKIGEVNRRLLNVRTMVSGYEEEELIDPLRELAESTIG